MSRVYCVIVDRLLVNDHSVRLAADIYAEDSLQITLRRTAGKSKRASTCPKQTRTNVMHLPPHASDALDNGLGTASQHKHI